LFLGLKREELATDKCGPKRAFKVDMEALRGAVEANPELLQKELAARFNVTPAAICYTLKRLKISRKKRGAIKNAIRKSVKLT
jgi:putative transposase